MSIRATVWLLTLGGVLTCVGLALGDDDGRELLRTALDKRGDVRFAGTEITERTDPYGNQHVVERRVVHDRGQREFSEFVRGPEIIKGQLVICDGRIRYRVMPAHKIALLSDVSDTPGAGMESRLSQALHKATVEVSRWTSGLTGRDAIQLTVKFPSEDAGLVKARQVTLDAVTMLILENREYRDGVEMSRTYLTSVDFAPDTPDSLFRYTPDGDTLVLPEPTQFPRPVDAPMAARLGPLAQPIPPEAFPRDWRPVGNFLQVYGPSPVLQITFVAPGGQGQLPVALFRRAIDDKECSFDGFYGLDDVGARPADVGHSALAWRADPFYYVLASRIDRQALRGASESIARVTHNLPKPPPPRGDGPHPRRGRPTAERDRCLPDGPMWMLTP